MKQMIESDKMQKLAKCVLCSVLLLLIILPVISYADSVNVPAPGTGPLDLSKGLQLGLPGAGDSSSNPAQLVADIYNFALMIAGLLAFGSILYGGIMYLTTGGNTSAQTEAKNRIKDAVIGLLLLIGIYFVLNLINPDLTNLKFPTLQKLDKPSSEQLPSNPTVPIIDPNGTAWACVPHGYKTGDVEKDPSKIKMCYTSENDCAVDSARCPGAGNINDCVSVKGSSCSATNAQLSGCVLNGNKIPDLTPLSGDAASMENGSQVVQVSSDSNISQNLVALQGAITEFRNLLKTKGASLAINSMYRPYAYQRHFYEIFQDYNALKNFAPTIQNSVTQACTALKTKVDAEKQKHGILDAVAQPDVCAPHVKGVAVDLSFTGITTAEAANLLSKSNINLYWRAISGDPVHFELKTPPYKGCASS